MIFGPLAIDDSSPLWAELERRYAEPPRHYHTFDHVREVLETWRWVDREVGWERPVETWLALLFHDVVYVAGRHDNEARSAEVAAEVIAGHLGDVDIDVGRVRALIELTARHGELDAAELSADEALLADCDMAILGADTDAFDAFDDGVRAEYAAVVPAELFDQGRRAFFEALVARERIFLSDVFRDRLEARARANIARRLAAARQTIGH